MSAAAPATLSRRWWARFTAAPAYEPTDADRRTFDLVGLRLPLRATTAIVVVTLVVLFDFTRTAIPQAVQALGREAPALRYQAIERVVLFGLVPGLVIVFAFRDRLAAYGAGLGEWRWGLALAVAGCAFFTPIFMILGNDPTFASYYAVSSASVPDLALTNLLDLSAAEFVIRGFLMFTLIRAIGPLGLVVAQLPFVFVHLGKPELELFSTLFGGMAYGWLNWRTGSIWWSALAHTYLLTLVVAVAGGTAGG